MSYPNLTFLLRLASAAFPTVFRLIKEMILGDFKKNGLNFLLRKRMTKNQEMSFYS